MNTGTLVLAFKPLKGHIKKLQVMATVVWYGYSVQWKSANSLNIITNNAADSW
jgi:hypothetical protein